MCNLKLLYLPPLLSVLLCACHSKDEDKMSEPESPSAPTPAPQRGTLINPPALVSSYSTAQLLGIASSNEVVQLLAQEILTPQCSIDVYKITYRTVDPAGNITPASAAMMVPDDSAGQCQGARPILLYAHGTNTNRAFDFANLQGPDNAEPLLLATAFASKGYIVVAPNYVGYDISTLGYHPYLNGAQQSKDMIDALAAARSSLPTMNAPATTSNGKLLVTGYSQGGYVAMATHRAMQETGVTITASAPMSGPYALSAFGDAIFQGQVAGGAPVNLTMILTSYQNAYRNLYTTPADIYSPQYATGIETLLPNNTSVGELKAQGRLPDTAVFSSTPPAPQYAAMTPATTPVNLAPVFATGFGAQYLLNNSFRLAVLQDAALNPDGGYPTLTNGLPPANPASTFRQALKTNDQRAWTPAAPMLLCAGNADPVVFYMNTALMKSYWATATNVTLLDIDSPATSGDPYQALKTQFTATKNVMRLTGGDTEVLQKYHAGLVAPFCLSAVKSFFDQF